MSANQLCLLLTLSIGFMPIWGPVVSSIGKGDPIPEKHLTAKEQETLKAFYAAREKAAADKAKAKAEEEAKKNPPAAKPADPKAPAAPVKAPDPSPKPAPTNKGHRDKPNPKEV